VDVTDANVAQDAYYKMSYHLSRTEDDAEVKKAVDEAQGVYDAHGKWEWVEWADKTLMPRMHAQITMEKVEEMRAEQDTIDEERIQAERAEREQERAAKEALQYHWHECCSR
jgi:hypothetical protein